MPDELVPGLIPVAPPEPLPRDGRERARSGVTVAGLAFLGFLGLFAAVKANRSERVDVAITLRLQARRYPSLARLMEYCSWPGFPPQSRIIPPAIMSGLWLSGHRTEAAFQLAAWGTAGISEVLKSLMRRQRPLPEQVRVVVAPLGGSSFPSGHVLTYMGTYGFAAYLAHTLIGPRPVRWPIVLLLLALLAGVGPSRIYQGHHWPTDVAASYLLGITYLIVLEAAYRRLRAPEE
jgi:undecaprenyl-diphosphatase